MSNTFKNQCKTKDFCQKASKTNENQCKINDFGEKKTCKNHCKTKDFGQKASKTNKTIEKQRILTKSLQKPMKTNVKPTILVFCHQKPIQNQSKLIKKHQKPTKTNKNTCKTNDFDQNDQKVLHLSWILQRFLNAISDMRNIKFSHQETQESGKSKSRSENIVFSNVNGSLFDPNDKISLN